MPSNRNYTTHWPWNRRKELPSLNAPTSLKNGKIEKTESGGSRFQWCPSDLPEAMRDDWVHTKDEFFYTINSNNYRATEFNKQDNSNATICLGDSFTFGIGVRDEDTWPYKLNELLGTVNWNLGSGGSSNKDILYTLHQFISNGYIPKNVYVMWSWSHRKVLSNKINQFLTTNPVDHLNCEVGDVEQYDLQRKLLADALKVDMQVQDITTLQHGMIDGETAYTQDLHHLEDPNNRIARAGLFLSDQTDDDYLRFYTERLGVIALCEANNIAFKESFVDRELAKFADAYIIPSQGWKTGKYAMWTGSLQEDIARDNGHFGPKTLTNIANYFYNET